MRLRDKRVLVTGSNGFVGRYLVRRLREKGARVVEFDLVKDKDITRWEDFRNIRKIDVVFHLAAKTFVPHSQADPRSTYEINLVGTNNVLELCRLRGSRLVFASSYVYGNPRYLPIDEKHPTAPTNPYARSKVMAEELCMAYHEEYGVPCVILRPFNIFGKGQSGHFLIPEIVRQLEAGDVVRLKDLNPRRDLLHVDDAVNAYVRAGEYDKSGFEIFNIGYGESFSVREIAGKLIDFSGRKAKLESLRMRRKGEIRDTVADISKAARVLGWKPRITIDKGLKSLFK
jgi:UDP-glucose 4-epimerase